MNITVIDALMGQGKTTYIFNMMNSYSDKRYIYISLLEDEYRRCQKECSALNMITFQKKHGAKYLDLIELVKEGRNIASTHQLFGRMTGDLYNALEGQGDSLIIDEALNVVEKYDIDKDDLEWLFNEKAIYVDAQKRVRWNHERWSEYSGKLRKLVPLCDNGNLVMARNKVLMWQFPAEFLEVFDHVFICTYLFEGQSMSAYFKAYGVPYKLMSLKDGAMVDYGCVDSVALKDRLASLIQVYRKRNVESDTADFARAQGQPFTDTWFKERCRGNASFQKKRDIDKQRKNIERFFEECGEGASTNMWTTFDKYRTKLQGRGYKHKARSFVPMNAKATNDYGHKNALAYIVDRRQLPYLVGFFEDMGIEFRQDLFSLTELVQWIWRSRIRDAEPITLYVPSERMRVILVNWVAESDADIVNGTRIDAKADGRRYN